MIGVYPLAAERFPSGKFMNKNLTRKTGNCNHRRYVPELLRVVQSGVIHPSSILSQELAFSSAIDAYLALDRREPGWTKVALKTAA